MLTVRRLRSMFVRRSRLMYLKIQALPWMTSWQANRLIIRRRSARHECEYDWGDVILEIAGIQQRLKMAVFTFAHSNGRYAYLFHHEDTLALMEAHPRPHGIRRQVPEGPRTPQGNREQSVRHLNHHDYEGQIISSWCQGWQHRQNHQIGRSLRPLLRGPLLACSSWKRNRERSECTPGNS